MDAFLQAVTALLLGVWTLVVALAWLLAPLVPIVAWMLWWLLVVDWRDVWPALRHGAWAPAVLIAAAAAFLWGTLDDRSYDFAGLTLGSLLVKGVLVAGLFLLAIGCGLLQPLVVKRSDAL